ncbi:MAG TPA: amidohydrolase family protein [Terracidiphilus sp.]|nr:amidohydrolase family protein [Terracidiphilus sp.]
MVVDVHSHFFRYTDHFSDGFVEQARRARNGVEVDLTVRWEEYSSTATQARHTIVFGGKARLAGLWVPDHEVAAYAKQRPEHLTPFLSLDPTQPGWQEEMREGHEDLGMKGIKLMPMYAGFRPCDKPLDDLWSYATKHHLPVLLHTGTTFIDQAPLEHTLPRHLDEVAIRFPEVRIIMAHIGHPYEGEAIAVTRKHAHVYTDCSALHYRPFQLYHSLMLAQEYGVWEKILFGSDYPFTTVDASIAGMRELNTMVEGTNLPRLNMDAMEKMFERDTLGILGLRA